MHNNVMSHSSMNVVSMSIGFAVQKCIAVQVCARYSSIHV